MVWHMTLNAPLFYPLWAWMFCDFPTGILTGIFVVCANKLILPFKSGGKALSVTCGDSSPKGRAKQGVRSLLKTSGFRTLLHRQEKTRGKALRDNLGAPFGELSPTPTGNVTWLSLWESWRRSRLRGQKMSVSIPIRSVNRFLTRLKQRYYFICPNSLIITRAFALFQVQIAPAFQFLLIA